MIAIIDYGMGNLRSVEKGFERAGVSARIVREPEEADRAGGVVLPGVGAFADAMENLRKTGMDLAVKRAAADGRPLLGICLGLQLLFEASEEWGYSEGLGIFPGLVRRLPEGLKVPHMGWNQVRFKGFHPIFEGVPDNSSFYFVHSYYVDPEGDAIKAGVTDYGIEFTSAVAHKNIAAIQFHPEKSSALGLRILRNFGGIVERC
ncbi:MAG: imidazole glycerol phosphate synthase subunit HisH [Peptococcaceae bacterium]|nr:imidazole glycerol phosphate synthase subunit HisH [Peptococcaceae bacterium]